MHYLKKVLTINWRSVRATKKTQNIKKMDVQWTTLINSYTKETKLSSQKMQPGYSTMLLQWERAAIPRNRYIGCGSWSKSFANEAQDVVPKEQNTKWSNTATNDIHKQELTIAERETLSIIKWHYYYNIVKVKQNIRRMKWTVEIMEHAD